MVITNNNNKIDWNEFKSWLKDENYPTRQERVGKSDWENMLMGLKECDDYLKLKNFLEIFAESRGESIYWFYSFQIEALEEWLREKKIIANNENIVEKKDWASIHEDFENRIPRGQANNIGYWNKKNWQDNWFNYEQTKAWIEVGLSPDNPSLAAYLRWKKITLRNQV